MKSQIEVFPLATEWMEEGVRIIGLQFSNKYDKRKVKINGMGWDLLQSFIYSVKRLFYETYRKIPFAFSLKKEMDQFIAFAFYAKSFAIAILVFFSFFLSFPVSFSGNILRLVIKEACHQDLAHSVDTARNISVKFVLQVFLGDTCSTRHGVFKITTIHNIQESTRNTQKLENKLASRLQKIQTSKQREIELIKKKV